MKRVIKYLLRGRGGDARFAGRTHQGKVRRHNEDAFAVDRERGVAVVADGMGGLARGDEASRAVVAGVMKATAAGRSVADGLVEADAVIRRLSAAGGNERIGSTAVALRLEGDSVQLAWVGDSRAYRWRAGQLVQLTRDHTFVQELIDLGAITPEEAETHPNRNVVTRAIGLHEGKALEIAQKSEPLAPGDRLLLCTDGLYGYLPSAGIAEVLAQGGTDDDIAQRLVDATLRQSDAGDNVTVVSISLPD